MDDEGFQKVTKTGSSKIASAVKEVGVSNAFQALMMDEMTVEDDNKSIDEKEVGRDPTYGNG